MEIMELMQNMRSKGKTYREIADELKRIKAKTKTGKASWHPMMVQRAVSHVNLEPE